MKNGELNSLYEIASAYQKSVIFLTAVAHRIFETLGEEELSVEDIGRRTLLAVRPLRMVLDVLAGMGLLKKNSGTYENSEAAKKYLLPESPDYMGDIFRHHCQLTYTWATLHDVLKTGKRVPRDKVWTPFEEREKTYFFIKGMENIARLTIPRLLDVLDMTGYEHMLDLGGGPAAHSIALCKKWPNLVSTVVDLPGAVEIGKRNVRSAGLSDRIYFIEADFLNDPIGTDYDFIFISSIIHIYDDRTNESLIKKCARSLLPGGSIAVKDMFVDDNRTGPLSNLIFAINMLVNTDAGDVYTKSDVKRWFSKAGLTPVEKEEILDPRTSILFGRKDMQ